MTSADTRQADPEDKKKPEDKQTVKVIFNTQHIALPKGEMTGTQIKAAAITAGVLIQTDFVMSVKKGGHRYDVVGDTDVVKVHEGLEFTAVDADDNS